MKFFNLTYLVFFVFSVSTFAPFSTVASNTVDKKTLIARLNPAIVKIEIDLQGVPLSSGTGFFVSETGELLTNYHVAKSLFTVGVFGKIRTADNQIVKYKDISFLACGDDRNIDLCLLKVPIKPKTWFKVGPVKAEKGEDVFTLGHPRGMDFSVSTGIVSGTQRMDSGLLGKGQVEFTQTTAPISPGNSGGPLFDSQGRLVGVITQYIVDGQNLNMAISANEVTAFYKNNQNKMPQLIVDIQDKLFAEKKQFPKKFNEENLSPLWKWLDAGKELPADFYTYRELKFNGLVFQIPVFKSLGKCVQDGKMNQDGSVSVASLSCQNRDGSAGFIAEIGPLLNRDLIPFNGKTIAEPQPLPIVSELMKNGKWPAIEKNLTDHQKKYLFTVPHVAKCENQAESVFPLRDGARICTHGVYNLPDLNNQTFVYLIDNYKDQYSLRFLMVFTEPAEASVYSTAQFQAALGTRVKNRPNKAVPIKVTNEKKPEVRAPASGK